MIGGPEGAGGAGSSSSGSSSTSAPSGAAAAPRKVAVGVRPAWDKACTYEGTMLKKSEWLKKWNSRYFRIRGRTLCYYESQMSKVARGEIPLIGAQVAAVSVPDIGKKFTLQVRTAKNQDLVFCALSEEDRRAWIAQIETAIRNPPRLQARAPAAAAAAATGASARTLGAAAARPASTAAPTEDHKRAQNLAEAEASSTATIEEEEENADLEAAAGGVRGLVLGADDIEDDEVLDGIGLAQRYPKNFVPPPPPPDAEDPLSYLLSVPAPAQSTTPSSPRARKVQIGSTDKADPLLKPRVPERRGVQRTSSGEAMQRMSGPIDSNAKVEGGEAKPPVSKGTALRDAIKAGDLSLVEGILSAQPELVTFKDSQSVSMLHFAAMFKHEEICMRLLAAGADPNALDATGETPLSLAPVSIANRMRHFQQQGAGIKEVSAAESEKDAAADIGDFV